jgi:hypothetical protein
MAGNGFGIGDVEQLIGPAEVVGCGKDLGGTSKVEQVHVGVQIEDDSAWLRHRTA